MASTVPIEQRDAVYAPHSIETSGLVWMALHGTLCLGLRHPKYVGASRQLVVEFVNELGRQLVEWGVLTSEELASVARQEQRESTHGGIR